MTLAPAYADPAKLTPALVRRYRDMMLAPGVRPAMLARMAQVRLTRPEPALRRITAPTLLLWGDRDAMIPPEQRGGLPAGHSATAAWWRCPALATSRRRRRRPLSLAPVLAFLE